MAASRFVDLRSDTVTLPTPAMRAAMASAVVGDDVYGEDPTVNRLEEEAATLVGKDAAVFVPSGTMGNLAAVLAQCPAGHEALVGDESHIFYYEAGGAAALGGVVYRTLPTRADGTLPLDAIASGIRPPNLHFAPAAIICLENTHNRCGGVVVGAEYFAEVAALAARHNLAVHLDGARLFNAVVATGQPATAWTRHVSSVQFCLSKGLSAPVGSLVAASRPVADRVRRLRKMLGGGMRQAGVLAAAGLVALHGMIDRLADDHANARRLAQGLASIDGLVVDLASVHTNIVIFALEDPSRRERFLSAAKESGVLLTDMGGGKLRAVTHADVSPADCERAIEVVRDAVAARQPA
jgi:threonine aldolase